MSNLAKYNQNTSDKAFPDHEETVLGHMIVELGLKPSQAVQKLRPWLKDAVRSTEQSKKISYGLALTGTIAGAAVGSFFTFGLSAVMPIVAGAWCWTLGQQSSQELKAREAEYQLIRDCPELLKIIYALSERGLGAAVIVEAYDDLVMSYQSVGSQGSELGFESQNEYNKKQIVETFQVLIAEKANIAGIASDMMDNFNLEAFDELYDRNHEGSKLGQKATVQRSIAPVAPQAIIGANTRLNAVEVPSQSMADPWDEPEVQSVAVAKVETNVRAMERNNDSVNLAKLIVDNIYSYAIISPSGGGKGLLTSHIVRELKKSRPDIHTFFVDPKDDPKESGYWQGFVDTWYKVRFADLNVKERSIWLKEMLEEYKQLPNPKVLILDETTAIFSHLKNCDSQLLGVFKSFISMIASSGNSSENYLMLMGHSPNLSDYGISGGDFVNFNKVFIANGSKLQAIKQLGTTTFTGTKFGQDVTDAVISKCKQSPVNRAFYMGVTDEWYPMDKLENFSGYDRDARKMLANAER